jgi:hemolysin III
MAGLVGLILLLMKAWGHIDLVIVSLVYGLAMTGLFTFSSLYHATKMVENAANAWRKLDHIAIFFMIAGTYTPISYIYLSGTWRWSMILVSWSFVIAGILLKVFFIRAPRVLSTILYLLMGWLAVIPLRLLWQNMPRVSFFLILGGGIAYSVGALIYALKRPNPMPGVFGFHEIFHLMILAGAILHYVPVYMAVLGAG